MSLIVKPDLKYEKVLSKEEERVAKIAYDIISKTSELDIEIGYILGAYYDKDGVPWGNTYSDLICDLPFSRKVNLLRTISRRENCHVSIQPLLKCSEIRNEFAHTRYNLLDDIGSPLDPFEVSSTITVKKKGKINYPIVDDKYKSFQACYTKANAILIRFKNVNKGNSQ